MVLSEWRVKASPLEIILSFFPLASFPWMLRSGFLAVLCSLTPVLSLA